jgi:hypothetical protein
VPWPPLRSARNWSIASGGLTDTSFPAGCDRAALSAVRYRYNVGRAYQGCGRPARAFVVAITGDVYGHTSDDTARAAVDGLAGRLGL